MKVILSAKILKAALKAIKTATDSYENAKGESLYGLNMTDKGLALQSAGGLFVSCHLTD